MGQFSVRVALAHPTHLERTAEVELLVDTRATLSWVPQDVRTPLDPPRLGRRSFLDADGRQVDRETVGVIMRIDGTRGLLTVGVTEPGDERLLGATALETLGYAVDPIRQRLVPHALLAM